MGIGRRPLPNEFPAKNVVDMTAFRKKLRATSAPELIPVFYLNEGGCSENALRSFPLLDIVDVNCPAKLEAALRNKKPAVILVESGVDWGEWFGHGDPLLF